MPLLGFLFRVNSFAECTLQASCSLRIHLNYLKAKCPYPLLCHNHAFCSDDDWSKVYSECIGWFKVIQPVLFKNFTCMKFIASLNFLYEIISKNNICYYSPSVFFMGMCEMKAFFDVASFYHTFTDSNFVWFCCTRNQIFKSTAEMFYE